jgi:hypothetical protein
MFPIKPTSFWNRRRVETPAEPARAGKLPSLSALLSGSPAERVAWGRELGRRFRENSAEQVMRDTLAGLARGLNPTEAKA